MKAASIFLVALSMGWALVLFSHATTDTDILMDRFASQFNLRSRADLPAIRNMTSQVTVVRDVLLGKPLFRYSYGFRNEPTNTGECVAIHLFISELDTFATTAFNQEVGFIDPRLDIVDPDDAASLEPIVATELENTPTDWMVIYTGGNISWICGNDCKNKLPPGVLVSGFKIKSRGLPRIRNFEAAALQAVEQFYPPVDELSETEADLVSEIARQDQLHNTRFFGKTLGPYVPPSDPSVTCDTFVLDLIGQVREAAALSWIKHDLRKDDNNRGKGKGDDKGVKKGGDNDDGGDHADDDVDMDNKDKNLPGAAKSIIKKLTKVRRECMRGKFGVAREKLRALTKQVNAQRGKHLTDEAFFLLKFNLEFLLEKL